MEHGHFFPDGSTQGDAARRQRVDSGGSAHGAQSRLRQALRGVVEEEILPRLRKSHPPGSPPPDGLDAFVQLLLAKDGTAALAHVASLREKTHSADGAFLDLLTRTARRFGELWEADRCDFVDVTVGLRRLQLILNVFGAEVEAALAVAPNARRILLLPAPGESHGFGTAMVQFSFRAAGWRADYGFAADYLSRLRGEWFDVVGFSVSCNNWIEPLRSAVGGARRASRNPAILVMAGGPPLLGRPELALAAGADGSADDAVGAVIAAQSLLDRRTTV